MMAEDPARVVEQFENAVRKKDWTRFENVNAESVVLQAPDQQELRKGRKAIREFYQAFTDAFPDLDPRVQRRFAQGEWVLGEYTVTGTHRGTLVGGGQSVPPTNKKIALPNVTLYRVRDGKITEIHEYFDQLGFLSQLGLVPPP